jgi:hypothetical protein
VKITLEEWTKEAERIEVGKNLCYFKQSVGLKFDKKKLDTLEKSASEHAKKFVATFGKVPRQLFLMSVESIGNAEAYRYYVKIHEAQMEKIVSKKYEIDGKPVNWGSWRQFASRTDDSAARKEVFDEFLGRSGVLTPLVRARFDHYAKILAKYDLGPLTNYLEYERISYERLTSFVETLGSRLKGSFSEALSRYSEEILGRAAEYYDDYYFFRARVFRKYEKELPFRKVKDPVRKIISSMKEMRLDASSVKVDDVNRRGKNSSAFCFSIKIPTDVRISYRKSNSFEDYSSVFHEFGHGVHGVTIRPDIPFWDKYGVANGVAEIFSIFFEGLIHDRLYLTEELGATEEEATDILSRFRFNDLFFATFYSASSMMKLRYWREGLSMEQADSLYSDLTEKFMGIRYPGRYWQLHHVMPMYYLYSPSYLIAAARADELARYLKAKYGDRYWKSKEAGAFVRSLLEVGQGIDLDSFSKLDADAFATKLTREA